MQVTDLKTGRVYKHNNEPHLVLKYAHIKVARGGANVKVKIKNLINGAVREVGYKASDSVEDADVRTKNAQYLYSDDKYYFMDPDTYEQFKISKQVLGDSAQFLVEGENIKVMYFENKPVSVELPNTMVFEVTYTEPGHKGNTVSTVYKDATLSNGAKVKVPSFIKIGDRVKIDTRDGSYVSKG